MVAASGIPYKFLTPWAADATSGQVTNPIPPTVAGGATASQQLGFPPATAAPVGSGGTPPAVADFNGGMNYTTSWDQWQQLGAPVFYDGALSAAVNGYPKGAVLASAGTVGSWWVNGIDNNTSDPDTGGSNWSMFPQPQSVYLNVTAGSYTTAIPAGVTTAKVTIAAGGGGGAGSDGAQAGGGGGGGAVGIFYLTGLVAGQVIAGSIGSPGAAGNSGGGFGGNGGNTTLVVNSVVIATAGGGIGGNWSAAPAGGGGGGVSIGTFSGAFVAFIGSYGTDGAHGGNTYGGNGAPGWNGAGAGRAGAGGGEAAESLGAGGGGAYLNTPGGGGAGYQGGVLIEFGR